MKNVVLRIQKPSADYWCLSYENKIFMQEEFAEFPSHFY